MNTCQQIPPPRWRYRSECGTWPDAEPAEVAAYYSTVYRFVAASLSARVGPERVTEGVTELCKYAAAVCDFGPGDPMFPSFVEFIHDLIGFAIEDSRPGPSLRLVEH